MRSLLIGLLIAANLLALVVFLGLRQYAHGKHDEEAKGVYAQLVERGLLDEAKVQAYADSHRGWHPKERLNSISDPRGFIDIFCVSASVLGVVNAISFVCILVSWKNGRAA